MEGYCRPEPAFLVNLNCGRFDGKFKCDTAQGFACLINKGKLKGFENNQEIPVDIKGITAISAEVTVLKQGVQCTTNQLINCQINQECINNLCADRLIAPIEQIKLIEPPSSESPTLETQPQPPTPVTEPLPQPQPCLLYTSPSPRD